MIELDKRHLTVICLDTWTYAVIRLTAYAQVTLASVSGKLEAPAAHIPGRGLPLGRCIRGRCR